MMDIQGIINKCIVESRGENLYNFLGSQAWLDVSRLPLSIQLELKELVRNKVLAEANTTYVYHSDAARGCSVGDVENVSSIFFPGPEDSTELLKYFLKATRYPTPYSYYVCIWRGLNNGPSVLVQKLTVHEFFSQDAILKPFSEIMGCDATIESISATLPRVCQSYVVELRDIVNKYLEEIQKGVGYYNG